MLSDEIMEQLTDTLSQRMQTTNEKIIKQVAETIKEIGTMTPTEANKMIQIIKYGGDYEKIVNELKKTTKLTQKDIEKVFEEIAKKDYKFAKRFYEYRKLKYIPWDQNEALKNQTMAIASEVNKEVQKIVAKNTLGLGVKKAKDKVEYKGLKKAYFDIVDNGILNISQGKETFDSLMYGQIRELGENGLIVMYKEGYHLPIETALRMIILDGIRTLHNEIQDIIGEQFDADGVEITVHSNPAPDHAYAQGRQLYKSEWEKLQITGRAETVDHKQLDLHRGYETFRPISKMNCYHEKNNIIIGVNKPQYTDKQLQEILDQNEKGFEYDGKHYTMYEGTQLQRRIENEIRKAKRFQISAINGDNEKGIIKAQSKITKLNKVYKEISEASGLKPKTNRMKVPGYKRIRIN